MTGRPLPRRLDGPRGSTLAAAALAVLTASGAVLVAVTLSQTHPAADRVAARDLAAALALSDVALFTEARYTRNPSLADLHSAFQDGPGSLEHFPTGSLVMPPRDLPAGRLEAREE